MIAKFARNNKKFVQHLQYGHATLNKWHRDKTKSPGTK